MYISEIRPQIPSSWYGKNLLDISALPRHGEVEVPESRQLFKLELPVLGKLGLAHKVVYIVVVLIAMVHCNTVPVPAVPAECRLVEVRVIPMDWNHLSSAKGADAMSQD
jgi:hypothetical protein